MTQKKIATGALVKSDLIEKLGFDGGPGTENGTLRIQYRSDGKLFDYEGVSFATFKKLITSKSRSWWLSARDGYKFKEVKQPKSLRLPFNSVSLKNSKQESQELKKRLESEVELPKAA